MMLETYVFSIPGSGPSLLILAALLAGTHWNGRGHFFGAAAEAIQIVDFYHAMEHARKALQALLGSKEHPDYKRRLRRWARQSTTPYPRRTQ